jgi:hypothetical protein
MKESLMTSHCSPFVCLCVVYPSCHVISQWFSFLSGLRRFSRDSYHIRSLFDSCRRRLVPSRIDQGSPWFSSVLEQMLSWYQNSTLQCMLHMQPSQRHKRTNSDHMHYLYQKDERALPGDLKNGDIVPCPPPINVVFVTTSPQSFLSPSS